MKDFKFPLVYTLQIKRGIKYSERRVEIDKDTIKYYKDKSKEVRFGARLEDCNLISKFDEKLKNYRCKLLSKTEQFDKVSLKHNNSDYLKKFYNEFNEVADYKNVMASLQTKSFVIETDEPETTQFDENDDDFNESEVASILPNNFDTVTKHSFETDNKKPEHDVVNNNRGSLLRNSITSNSNDNKINDRRSSLKVQANSTSAKKLPIDHYIQEVTEGTSNDKLTFKQFDSRSENKTLLESIKNIIENNWNVIKLYNGCVFETNTKDTININYNSQNLVIKNENTNKFKIYLLDSLKNFVNSEKFSKTQIIPYLLLICVISLSVNYTLFFLVLSSVGFFYRLFFKNYDWVNIDSLDLNAKAEADNSSSCFSFNPHKIKNNYIKVSETLNHNLNDILNTIVNYKSYRDWNPNLAGVELIESKAKYVYVNPSTGSGTNKKEEVSEVKSIKRKVFNFRSRILVVEINEVKYSIVKFWILVPNEKNPNNVKVSLYINNNPELPIIFFESHFKSVSCLKIYLTDKSFLASNSANKFNYNQLLKLNALYVRSEHSVNMVKRIRELDSMRKKEQAGRKISEQEKSCNEIEKDQPEPEEERKEIFTEETVTERDNHLKEETEKDLNPEDEINTDQNNNKVIKSTAKAIPDLNLSLIKEVITPSTFPIDATVTTSQIDLEPKLENVVNLQSSRLNTSTEQEVNLEKVNRLSVVTRDNFGNSNEARFSIANEMRPSYLDKIIHEENESTYPGFESKPLSKEELENSNYRAIIKEKRSELEYWLVRDWITWVNVPSHRIYYFDDKSGIRSVKSDIIINKPIKVVFDFIRGEGNNKKFDPNLDVNMVIKNIDDHHSLSYSRYKGKFMIAPREFCNISYCEITEDSAVIIGTSDPNSKYDCKIKNVVRADLMIGGYLMKKMPDNQTELMFFSQSDLKIAQFLVNLNLKSVCECVKNIKDLLMLEK